MKTKRFLLSFSMLFFLLVCLCFSSPVYAAYTSSYTEPTILIHSGCYGSGVRWVQDMLNHNGYQLAVDGDFGSKTLGAVKSFQAKYNLAVDGIVGNATRKALKTYATTSAGNVTATTTTLYTTANLNLRSGASTSYSILMTIPKGSAVSVISQSSGWAYVKYNTTYGYVSAKYLTSTHTTTASQSLPTFSRSTTNLMTIIKNCKNYYATNKFYYSTAAGVRSIPADQSKAQSGYYYTDCSCYVSWVLYEYALANGKIDMQNYFSYQRNSATFQTIASNGGNAYLSVVSKKTSTSNINIANAKPGDILVSSGHVEFFNSYTMNANGTVTLKVYNCGSTSSIQATGITTSATKNLSDITAILRVK